MSIKEALYKAFHILKPISQDAFLEAEILIRHILGIGRAELFSHWEKALSPEKEKEFWTLIHRRLNYEPIPYIVGHREFYGLDFYVTPDTFIPRPESELLVERAIELSALFTPEVSIADVGTGCGAIAISLAFNLPQAKIYAIDISPKALEVAERNLKRYKVEGRVHLLLGDFLSPLPQPVNIIIANLPYIPTSEIPSLPPEVRLFEPIIALDGGEDGLEKLRQFLLQVPGRLQKGGYLLIEIGAGQGEKVKRLITNYLPSAKVEIIPDLAGIPRIVQVVLTKQG